MGIGMRRLNYFVATIAVALTGAAILAGCGERAGNKEIIGYVNKEPILASDLKREVAARAKADPRFVYSPETEAEQLDLIISKKLILQEAIREGLAQKDSFVDTVRTFWEQALIRSFVEHKRVELAKGVTVADADIAAYYANLGYDVTFRIVRSRSKQYIDKLAEGLAKAKDDPAVPWQTVGPVGYEDTGTSVLLEAFAAPKGEVKTIDDGIDHYLITVVERAPRPVEPLEKLKPEIASRARELKIRKRFDAWIRDSRAKASVRITGVQRGWK